MRGKLLAIVERAAGDRVRASVGGALDGFLRRGGREGRDRVLLKLAWLSQEVRRRHSAIEAERSLVNRKGLRRSLRVEAEARREEAEEDMAEQERIEANSLARDWPGSEGGI